VHGWELETSDATGMTWSRGRVCVYAGREAWQAATRQALQPAFGPGRQERRACTSRVSPSCATTTSACSSGTC